MIADTSFIIDIMEQLPEALQKATELANRQERMIITTITVFELWSGIAKSSKPEQEKRKVEEMLQFQQTLGFDQESAVEGGKINGLLQKERMMIDQEDCMIAGIAKHHREIIVTRNIKHFGRIKDLKLERY